MREFDQAGDNRAVQLLGVAFRAMVREARANHQAKSGGKGALRLFHAAAHLLAPYGVMWDRCL